MAAFLADSKELETLYQQYSRPLFALCYLHTGKASSAFALMRVALYDMALEEKRFVAAAASEEGFFRSVFQTCAYYHSQSRRAKRKLTVQETAGQPDSGQARAVLPFTVTDTLRGILRLSSLKKCMLYFSVGLQWSAEKIREVTDFTPRQTESRVASALKKLSVSRETARTALLSLDPGEAAERVWDMALFEMGEKDFTSAQRYRLFRRGMDNVIPYIALGVLLLCGFSWFAVDRGWLGAQPYVPSKAGTVTSPAPNTEDPLAESPAGPVEIFVPADGGFTRYTVRDVPPHWEQIVSQMVALGGAPEGTRLLRADLFSNDLVSMIDSSVTALVSQGDEHHLTLEFSQDAADAFADDTNFPLFQAMAATVAGRYQDFSPLTTLSFQSGGKELACSGKTAQDLLTEELTVTKTVEIGYREAAS